VANIDSIMWTRTDPISIREYASTCGFNLLTIDVDKLAKKQRIWIEKVVINSILAKIDDKWEDDEWGVPLHQVIKGVYVITMAANICIEYKNGMSQVIYIGRGQIRKRIYSHFKNWITYFTESLQDIRFRFWMTEIKVPGSATAFHDVESELICRFKDKFGEFPLLNSIYGKNCGTEHSYNVANLTKPFRNERAIKGGWCIKPMPENQWFKMIEAD
jgi:hypothetical protein